MDNAGYLTKSCVCPCGAVGPLCKGIQPLKWWRRSGMDNFKKLGDSIRCVKHVGRSNAGKETKSGVGGMQHLNSQSDWLGWQCNGRGYNGYQGLLCVFLHFLPVLQICPNEANKSESCQHVFSLSISPEHKHVFSLTDLMQAFQAFSLLDLNLLHSVLLYFDVSAENCKA